MKKQTKNKKEDTKEISKLIQGLTTASTFLQARPDLVGLWMIGSFNILTLFKRPHRELLITYLVTVTDNFFSSMNKRLKKNHPDVNFVYLLGTQCKNQKGEERIIIGIDTSKKDKPVYDYVDDNGKIGACNESSMTSWMEKR